jgi:hypothetical protein
MRRLTLMAISKEMATKDGIEELREAVKGDVERLREELKSYVDARMSGLNLSLSARINDLYGVDPRAASTEAAPPLTLTRPAALQPRLRHHRSEARLPQRYAGGR